MDLVEMDIIITKNAQKQNKEKLMIKDIIFLFKIYYLRILCTTTIYYTNIIAFLMYFEVLRI